MKTGLEVEDDIYRMLQDSPNHLVANGRMYKGETRPFQERNSIAKEDIVVRYLTGLSSQIQDGVVIVNVYCPYIKTGDKVLVRNTSRCQVLERKLEETLHYLRSICSEYKFDFDGAIQTYNEDDIEQTFSTLRIRYWVLET